MPSFLPFLRRTGTLATGAALLGLLVLSGCKNHTESMQFGSSSRPAEPTFYRLHGIVLGVSPDSGSITVRHDAIHGFMPAMTMLYKLRNPSEGMALQPGDEIVARLLVPTGTESYKLDQLKVLGHTRGAALATLPAHTLQAGEPVPDIPFENQDAQQRHLRGYSGQVLLLTFVYTRCPLPAFCPRISSHFAHIYQQIEADPSLRHRAHLITVTLDPAYDTPQVLRAYGINYQQSDAPSFSDWEFVRTSPADLRRLADAFGLEYSESNNQITHSMRTVMIGSDHRVIATWYGSDWTPENLVTRLRAAVRAFASAPHAKPGAE